MGFNRMELEIWFDRYQYEIDHDIGGNAEEIKTGLSYLNQALDELHSQEKME